MTTQKVYRHYDLNIRSTTTDNGLTVIGIGVPYDRETELVPGYFERFAPGSVIDDKAILRYAHAEPIGIITGAEDTPEGRMITGQISDIQRGRDIATLIRDGVLSKFSIGFYIEDFTEENRDGQTHVTINRARAVEYSVVEFPAYDAAQITSIRSAQETPTEKETPMANTTTDPANFRAELDTMNTGLEELTREVRALAARTDTTPTAPSYRSIGEYAKALASGDEMAARAYSGAVIGDTIARAPWLGLIGERMTAKMRITKLFAHTTDLPGEGMTVEYAVRKDPSTIKVAKQAKEGDALTKGKTGTYEVKSAPIYTYGGYGTMSQQAIERATISLLDDLFYEQAMMYATEIEAQTRALFESLVTTAEENPLHTVANLAQADVNTWTDIALRLIDTYDESPYTMDGLLVSPDVFTALAHLDRAPKALQFTSAPTDHHGTLTLATGSADFASINVHRVPNWQGKHAVAYSRDAIRIKEAPGTPFRLQDSNILDLTKEFAVYGYAAHFAPIPELIKAIKFTA